MALAPWFLGSLYACLNECTRNITQSLGQYNVVSYVDVNFLQLFLWERFQGLSTKPRVFKAPQTPARGCGQEGEVFPARLSGEKMVQATKRGEGAPYVIDRRGGKLQLSTLQFYPRGVLPIALHSPKSGGEPKSLRARLAATCGSDADSIHLDVREWGVVGDLQLPATTVPIRVRPGAVQVSGSTCIDV